MSRPATDINTVTDINTLQQNADKTPLRFVTAASLFDGHDVAINIMRRLIQAQGCEVIHLGHNRSVLDVVRAAIQEDADAIAMSSYQGGHNEYFRFMIDQLRERGAEHIQVFGGGGGTITLEEIAELEAYGVNRIYHPDDGMGMGLVEMIKDVVERARVKRRPLSAPLKIIKGDSSCVSSMLSALESELFSASELKLKRREWQTTKKQAPVIGITGTGGAGKSSVTDELLNRILTSFPEKRIAVLAVDPTRRRTGGALLGDRIRMNSLRSENIYMRSMATRRQNLSTNAMLHDAIDFLKSTGVDLVLVETAGIGQSDSAIVDMVDFSIYVMTSEFGAQSQLEKIDMLDFAELVVLNKFDKRAAEDALRDVRKQWKRNHLAFTMNDEDVPVYPTIASQFNDPGISWMFVNLMRLLREKLELPAADWTPDLETENHKPTGAVLIPGSRSRYLAEIAEQGRDINQQIKRQAETASLAQNYYEILKDLGDQELPKPFLAFDAKILKEGSNGQGTGKQDTGKQDTGKQSTGKQGTGKQAQADTGDADADTLRLLRQRYNVAILELSKDALALLRQWPARKKGIRTDNYSYQVRGKEVTGSNFKESLSRQQIPKIGMPRDTDWGELLSFLMRENLPGSYPYTAGVFPYRRTGEDPTRMFAGEGTPERTNRRFHYLSKDGATARLSTAFDSVTLYGEDPHTRPDIYGKVGNAGVSIASLDDMKKLYSNGRRPRRKSKHTSRTILNQHIQVSCQKEMTVWDWHCWV